MKIFITGATGYVGSMVAEKLKHKGHEVSTLVRTHESETQLKKLGYKAIIGDMLERSNWQDEAANSDVII
jgi:nucleoside-diphosphate-sugar epimerase